MKGYAANFHLGKAIVGGVKWRQRTVGCLPAVNGRRYPTWRRGFTLIELLVVIGIIVLIAAIIFPIYANARKRALYTIDISNLRQLGMAIRMYQQDYGCFPCCSDGDADWQFHYAGDLLPYTRSPQVFVCPMDWHHNLSFWRAPCTNCSYTSYQFEFPSLLDPPNIMNDWPVYLRYPSDYPFAVDGIHWYQGVRGQNELPPILRDSSLLEPVFVLRGDGRVSRWRLPVENFLWSDCHIIQIATGEWPTGSACREH